MKHRLQCGLLLFLVAVLLMLQVSADAGTLHWYCIRNKANRQPPIPPEFSFVEDFGGYYIDRTHTDGMSDKVVYLTFDVGYENGNVEKVLDALAQAQAPAAFFILKHVVEANGALVERMVREGHTVCNHTANHPDLSQASKERIESELEALNVAYKALIGSDMPKYFRPPEGSFSEQMMQSVYSLGYKTVFWSFAYADWDNNKQPSHDKAMRCIMDNIHNGAVILLHPTSATNATILPQVLSELKAQGYRFGTLEELCAV